MFDGNVVAFEDANVLYVPQYEKVSWRIWIPGNFSPASDK